MRSLQKGKLLLIAAALLPLTVLEANPGFSRQMDMDCMACHNQTMSQLNSFGRKFAASGFTMASGVKSMIDGDTIKLGLPTAVNAGVLLKARYIKTEFENTDTNTDGEEVGTDRGNLEIFKVSKLFFGGKIAENVGGFINYEYDSIGGKMVFAGELGSGYAGVSAYMQNDFGPFSGMEYYNTGLYAPLKLFENRKGTNAAQATDLGHGPATGAQVYYAGDVLYAMAGAYVPATSEQEGLDVGTDMIGIGRIAVAPTFGEWTVMVGAYGLNGTGILSDSALDNNKSSAESKVNSQLVEITREAFGLDMQVEGRIGGMSMMITLNAVLKNKTELYHPALGNEDKLSFTDGAEYKAGDNEAFSAAIQVNPREDFGVKVAYLNYDDQYDYRYSDGTPTSGEMYFNRDKWDREEYSLGFDYNFRQNVRFGLEYTYSDYDINDKTSGSGELKSLQDGDTFFVYAMIGF